MPSKEAAVQDGQYKPGSIELEVPMVVNPRSIFTPVIILGSLPEIYLVKFKLIGHFTKAGMFMVDLVSPLEGHPELTEREVGHLALALNEAAKVQVSMPLSIIKPGIIQPHGTDEMPRRLIRMVPEAGPDNEPG